MAAHLPYPHDRTSKNTTCPACRDEQAQAGQVLIGKEADQGYSSEAPSGRLRWSSNGRLQQEWIITEYDEGHVAARQKIEWRLVPDEK